MTDKELKRILLTTGYTTQTDKDAVYIYIKQLKEVIEEVREYIEKECSDLLIGYLHNRFDATEYYEKLLQILDKAKDKQND